MSDARTAPMKSLTEIQINSTNTVVNIGLDEAGSHPTVLFTTGSVQTQMVNEELVANEGWDLTKNAIASGMLRECYEQHVTDIAMFLAAGIKTALEKEGHQ